MPNSSAATANTKSAWLSGRMRFTVPSPGPRPNQPPRRKDSTAFVDLERVARRRIEEAVDALRHVRHGEIGAGKARRRRRRQARRPRSCACPAMKNSAPHTSTISMVWPKSGCSTSGTTTAPSRPSASVLAGISGLRVDSANSQEIRITKAGLRNSDGWMLTPASTIQRRAPFTSAPNTSVARRHADARGRRRQARGGGSGAG